MSKKKRVGRGSGSGHGKTSCRGEKGQKSRSGKKIRLGFEGGQIPLIRRIPKRGFNNKRFSERVNILNLSSLRGLGVGESEKGSLTKEINGELLRKKGIIKKAGKIKILGEGKIDRPLVIKADFFSKSARMKIEKTGGKAISTLAKPKLKNPKPQ
jgi:large subunit ribosomal protein L15